MHINKGFFEEYVERGGDAHAPAPELNAAQREAVEAPHGPLLIVAGAGTGKTKTLTSRLRRILEEGVPADRICALTFTNKAAREMRERARIPEQWRGDLGMMPFIGTFHSLGARILRNEAGRLGRTRHFAIFDDHDSRQLIKKITGAEGEKKKTGGQEKSAAQKDSAPAFLLRKISDLKNGVASREELLRSPNPKERAAVMLFERYESALEEHNAFDFDDLIEKVVFLFEEYPETRKKYAARAEYLLIDEYQDLNNMQYTLVRLLSERSRKVSAVGDDQQMIYAFRGSNFDIFLNFEKDWEPARVVLLEQNYRSTNIILDAASAVISHNIHQKPKKLWTAKAGGSPIRIFGAADEDDEAQWVAREITNDRLPMTNDGGAPTTAILYRTNAQSRAIEQALLLHEIPYRIFGGIAFYERREVKDIIAALRYAANPRDSISRDRLSKTFRRTIFEKLVDTLRTHADEAPARLIGRVLAVTNYVGFLEHNFSNAEERIENIRELAAFAAQFMDTPEFLERVALLQATDLVAHNKYQINHNDTRYEIRDTRHEVSLMTIHLAKGLEFDAVFLVGVSEGLLPHARSMESARGLEEERRLMYVAMTRARRELRVSFSDVPSRFISEIPEECAKYEEADAAPEADMFSDRGERVIEFE